MGPAVVIERATAADAQVVVGHLTAQLREHDIATPVMAIRNAVAGALAHPERAVIFCARAGDEIIGVAYLSFIWALEHGGWSAWLEELYVTPAQRSRGIGKLLLAAAIAHARAAGCAAVDLEVTSAHTRAANLYARQGFVTHDRTRWILRLK